MFRTGFLTLPSMRNKAGVLLAVLMLPAFSLAHPMGNFSINHESKIAIRGDSVEVRYFLDMAEIPTYQELQGADLQATQNDPKVKKYVARQAELLRKGLALEIDGRALPLRPVSWDVIFPPGAGGLPTMKFGIIYRGPLPAAMLGSAGTHRLHFADNNYSGRAGWKEVVVAGNNVSISTSSAPSSDRSAELSNYPADMLNSPPQEVEAAVDFVLAPQRPGEFASGNTPAGSPAQPPEKLKKPAIAKPPVALATSQPQTAGAPTPVTVLPPPENPDQIKVLANQQKTPRNRFTELVAAKQWNFWFVVTAFGIAFGLGALHALEPGHGKTIVAAYLVGSRGTMKDAVLLGGIVTAAHTAGVYLLGLATLYASHYILPDRLYPWLAMLSGLIICGMGIALFLQHWSGASLQHDHAGGGPHSHWGLGRKPAPVVATGDDMEPEAALAGAIGNAAGDAPGQASGVPLSRLLTLGITGGMIPCPAALVVLLSAVTLHRIGFGLALILAFSVGLATVLIVIGIGMVHAGKWLSRLNENGKAVTRWMPLLSSGFITILGAAMLWQAVASAGVTFHLSSENLPAFIGVVGLGLILGMRHSTDPDHVIAVTTIVSRQRSIRGAAIIGALWGVGHTLTIFVVGSIIILFKVVIPPRLGLSMEFSVAIMLIILGVMNLTGLTQWLSSRFSRLRAVETEPKEKLSEGVDSRPLAFVAPPTEAMLGRKDYGINKIQIVRPLLIGTVHGLAGSAAVALLVLATITTPIWAIVYLLIFGFGTVLGMMIMTAIIAVPFAYSVRFTRLNYWLRMTSGVTSTGFGLFLVYHIGFVNGLFTNAPRWVPQ